MSTHAANLGRAALSQTNLPGGCLAYCSSSSANTNIGTVATDLVGNGDSSKMSVTPTVAANRFLLITYNTVFACGAVTGPPDWFDVRLSRDGTVIHTVRHAFTDVLSEVRPYSGICFDNAPSAGTHVYKLTGQTTNGAGNYTVQEAGTMVTRLGVFDMGPSF